MSETCPTCHQALPYVSPRDYYVIQKTDAGKPTIFAFNHSWLVANFMGKIMTQDIGKRVYRRPMHDRSGYILDVEGNEQFEKRLRQWPSV